MTKKVWMFIIGLSLEAVLVGLPAFAQSKPLRVSIPFHFIVGDVQFTPGKYTAQLVTSGQQVLKIRSEDGRQNALVVPLTAHSEIVPDRGRLVFNRYGNEYFLSHVWWGEHTTGCELLKSSRETDLAKRVESQSVSVSPVKR